MNATWQNKHPLSAASLLLCDHHWWLIDKNDTDDKDKDKNTASNQKEFAGRFIMEIRII